MDLQEYKYVANFKEMVTPIFDLEVYFYQDNESVISYLAMAQCVGYIYKCRVVFLRKSLYAMRSHPAQYGGTFDGPPTL